MRAILLVIWFLVYGVVPLYSQSANSVSGRVVAADGTPMAGVQVLAKPGETNGAAVPAIVTQTDSSGQYRFDSLPPGTYDLSAVAGDAKAISLHTLLATSGTSGTLHPPAPKDEVSPLLAGPARVTVPIATNTEFSIVVLPSAVEVSGRLVIPPDMPRPSPLKLTLMGTTLGVSDDTDIAADGSFELTNVPPGNYVLGLIPNLGISPTQITVIDRNLTGVELGSKSTEVRVRGNVLQSNRPEMKELFPQWVYLVEREATNVQISNPAILWVITERAGERETVSVRSLPIPQVFVMDQNASTFEAPIAPVGLDGRFEFLAVPPGSYSMRTIPDVGIPINTIAVAGDADIDNVRVGVGVRVRGEVVPTNLGTRPPELINLVAVKPEGQSVSAEIDAGDGSFEFPRVGPGTYRILLDGKVRPAPSEIIVGDAENIIRVEGPFNSWIPGHVGFVGPPLPPDVLGAIRVALTNGFQSALQPDGSFRLPSTQGEFEFFVSNLPEGYLVKSMSYGTDDLMNEPVKVDSSNATRDIQVTVEFKPGIPQ